MLARRFVEWLIAATDRALVFLGIGDLSLEMTGWEKRALVVVTALPVFALFAWLYQLGYEIDNGRFGMAFPPPAEHWRRLYLAADVVLSVAPLVAVSLLVFHCVGPVGRGLGAWCFVAAASLVAFALLAAVYAGLVYFIINPSNYQTQYDLHLGLALGFAENASIIAFGYSFLAYRGLRAEAGAAA